MKRCIILLPEKYNDGTTVPEKVINGILKEIDTVFDGHTIGGNVQGTYRMSNGHMVTDISLVVWVAVNSNKIEILKKMAGQFARTLKQESIYFEVMDSTITFIKPTPESEGA